MRCSFSFCLLSQTVMENLSLAELNMRVGVVGSPRCGGVSPGPPVPLVFLPPQIPILCYCVQTIALIHIYFSLVWYFLYCEG